MQTSSKKEIMMVVVLTSFFLLGGVIHVVIDPLDFTSCIVQIYYSTLVLAWGVTIRYRIVNQRVRRLILMTVGLLLLAFFLQMCRYRVFEAFVTARRYFWYGYYIPVLLTPVLFLFVVLHLHLQEDERPNRRWLLVLVVSLCLIALVMTNDLHQLVFRYESYAAAERNSYTHGAWFYLIYVWVFAVLFFSLFLAIRKHRIPSIRKKLWIPFYFAAYGILIVLNLFDFPRIGDITIWLLMESLAMLVIGMEESCIQLGLIPANSSYRMVAKLANKPFIISDESGAPVYIAEAAREMFQRKENIQTYTKPIKGGSVSWAVDLTDMVVLNRQIEKATESIESRNAYLQTENELKEEQSRLTARNALYNQIAGIVSPQLDTIEGLLEKVEDHHNLAKIAFLNAYIKRRSNMELLKFDRKHFPTEELASAIRESCEYLKLLGVNAMLHITPEWELPADLQLFLYEAFETVVEGCLDNLELLLVNITLRKGQPVLRMALKASALDLQAMREQLSCNGGLLSWEAEDDERMLTITRQEGGSR